MNTSRIEKTKMPVLLASGSPQRKAILEELGISYKAIAMDVAERQLPTPEETVLTNAQLKFEAARETARHGQAIIAADTIVWFDGKILGKPGTPLRAKKFLEGLSGQKARVYSGIAIGLCGEQKFWLCSEFADMYFRILDAKLISWYIGTGEPLTRAGAIGISHYGELLLSHIAGSYSCIAGLPKNALLYAIGQSPTLANAILPFPVPKIRKNSRMAMRTIDSPLH